MSWILHINFATIDITFRFTVAFVGYRREIEIDLSISERLKLFYQTVTTKKKGVRRWRVGFGSINGGNREIFWVRYVSVE